MRRWARVAARRRYTTAAGAYETDLQHKPWTFENSPSASLGSAVEAQNKLIRNALNGADYAGAVLCAVRMKQANIAPNDETYILLLQACAHHPEAAEAILEEVLLQNKPSVQMFDAILSTQATFRPSILLMMDRLGILPSPTTYSIAITKALDGGDYPLALALYGRSVTEHGTPDVLDSENLFRALADQSLPRLALDLLTAFEARSPRRVSTQTWIHILESASNMLWLAGTQRCWDVIQSHGATPDEGLCIQVLNTAGRHGDPALASSVLEVVAGKNLVWEEWHFAPVVEAFARAGRIKEAMSTFAIMRSSGVNPSVETGAPILEAIRKQPALLDPYWSFVDNLKLEEQPIDIVVLHILLAGALSVDDFQRAMGLFQSFQSYGHKPNVDTYNILLGACVRTNQWELGTGLVEVMQKDRTVKANQETWEHTVLINIQHPDSYEGCFNTMRKMDDQDISISNHIYLSLMERLLDVGDARWEVAFEALQERDCKFPSHLELKITSQRRNTAPSEQHPEETAVGRDAGASTEERLDQEGSRLDSKSRDYIDSGGLL